MAVTRERNGYQVTFVRDLDRARKSYEGQIQISPSSDKWNDFGFRIRADVILRPRRPSQSAEELNFECFFGIADRSCEYGDIRDLEGTLDTTSQSAVNSEELPNFFTMLPDMQAYRRLVDQLGADEANAALEAMHDMVAAEESSKHPDWLGVARETEVFLTGFLRFSESYFAWKNAGSILLGEDFEELGSISDAIRVRFRLSGRPNEHDLIFRFSQREPILPKRISVLIGKNGVGKSQTLNRIASFALKGERGLTNEQGERPLISRILAYYPTYASYSGFPAKPRRASSVWYRRFSLSSPGFGRNRTTTSDLIVQLMRSDERIRTENRYQLFMRAIRAIEGYEELALPERNANSGFILLSDFFSGSESRRLERYSSVDLGKEPVRYSEGQGFRLSSGEAAFVRFAALTSLYIENGTLLLIDEPETHLHPNFIGQFVALLDELLEQTGSVAVISTHSVYFVRETFEDQVIVLRSGPDREIISEQPRLKTFGADVGAISYFVFGEDMPSRLAKDVEARITDGAISFENVFDEYKDDISLDLLSEIRSRIEDTQSGEGET